MALLLSLFSPSLLLLLLLLLLSLSSHDFRPDRLFLLLSCHAIRVSLPKTPLMKEARKEGRGGGFFWSFQGPAAAVCVLLQRVCFDLSDPLFTKLLLLTSLYSLQPSQNIIIKKLLKKKPHHVKAWPTYIERGGGGTRAPCLLSYVHLLIHPSIHPLWWLHLSAHPSLMVYWWLVVHSSGHIHPSWCISTYCFSLRSSHSSLMVHSWLLVHSHDHIHPSWCIRGYWFTLMVTSIPHGASIAIASHFGCHIQFSWCIGGYCFTLVVTSIPHGALVAIGWLGWPHPSHIMHCWLLVYASDHIHSSWCIHWWLLVHTSDHIHSSWCIHWWLLVHTSDHIHSSWCIIHWWLLMAIVDSF